jgi:hypothetical protein
MLPTPLSDLDLQAAEKAYVDHLAKVLCDLYNGLEHASNDAARNAALRRATVSVAKAREIRLLVTDILNNG